MSHNTGCRSCGNVSLKSIARWQQPGGPAKSPYATRPTTDYEELVFCPACALVHRIGESGRSPAAGDVVRTSDSTAWSARHLTQQIIATQKLRPSSMVIEIGSRDGRLLSDYHSAGIPVLGIEPAVKLAELARLEYNVPTLCRHFDKPLALELALCCQSADVVHMHHSLSLVSELNTVIGGLHAVLKDTGVAVIDTPYVKHLIERRALWSAHTGQRNCFSLTSLGNLVARHKLVLHDVERTGEGSTLRVFLGRRGHTSERVTKLLAEEESWGVNQLMTYMPPRPAKVA
jgi:SAM-dependent methyltransferase